MKILVLLSAAFLFTSPKASAYIPRAKTIIKKMARNNGRFSYVLVREVALQSPNNQIKAKETWYVANGDKMKLKVESMDSEKKWSFVIHYGKNKRQTISSNKNVKSFSRSPEFFEPLFHDRSSKSLTKRMMAHKFIPDWLPDSPDPDYVDGKTQMTPESFVRLAPADGTISYAIGSNKNTAGDNSRTTLWVEQDSFLIRKGRLRSKAEFINSRFQSFAGSLKVPSEQTISWSDKVANIKLMTTERFKPDKNTWKINITESGSIPSDPLIKEFYSRFR